MVPSEKLRSIMAENAEPLGLSVFQKLWAPALPSSIMKSVIFLIAGKHLVSPAFLACSYGIFSADAPTANNPITPANTIFFMNASSITLHVAATPYHQHTADRKST